MNAVAMDVAAASAEEQGLRIESQAGRFEPVSYGSDARLSPAVVLLWLCAFAGLGAYVAGQLIPGLGH